tara:strand:- start:382 stop:954 length:573 start_codon:yes stop_codon:yes gene_type:complete
MESTISVSGKQTKVGSSLELHVKNQIASTLKKYFSGFINSEILFSKDKFNFKCEINIHLESNIFVKSHSLSNDAYGAFNIANDKIKKRIRRYHRKLTDHRLKKTKLTKTFQVNEYIIKNPDELKLKDNENNPIIIAESDEIIKNLSVSEALMLMNLNDKAVYFFKNSKNDRINILFKRSDGNIGWLDPKK